MAVSISPDVLRHAQAGEHQALVRLMEAYQGRVYARGLATPQRQALTLDYLEDRPYGEIGTSMGVPHNTVKGHILRGKERMARSLDMPRVRGGRGFGLATVA